MLAEALYDIVFIIGQREEDPRRGREEKPSQRKPLPKGFHKGARTYIVPRDQEERGEGRSRTSKRRNDHRRAVASMIHTEPGVCRLVSNSVPGSLVHGPVEKLEERKRVIRRE